MQREDPNLGIVRNTKETLTNSFKKICEERFARGLVPYASVIALDGL